MERQLEAREDWTRQVLKRLNDSVRIDFDCYGEIPDNGANTETKGSNSLLIGD